MSVSTRRMIIWAPRALGLLLAAFISLFALDVFSEDVSLWEALAGLAIHLIPTYLILIGIAVAWRRPVVGGAVLIGLAVASFGFFGQPGAAIVGVPLAVAGCLFIFGDIYIRRAEPRPAAD